MIKYIKIADLMEVLALLKRKEVSFSRAVEMLNEKVENVLESINKVFSELALQAPLLRNGGIVDINIDELALFLEKSNFPIKSI